MRIALVGYGKMGKRIEALASAMGHEISHRIGIDNASDLQHIDGCDVAIEFTAPEAAVDHLQLLFRKGIPTVTGTTGWYEQFEQVRSLALHTKARFLYATNFSIGVQLAFAANAYLAELMNRHEAYACSIEEWHHTEKKDAPSGTAISIAEGIIAQHHAYAKWALEPHNKRANALPIKAYREADVPGTHRITYKSAIDEISLEHKAHGRDGFALGAIHAAEWLTKQASGIYTMNDFLKL